MAGNSDFRLNPAGEGLWVSRAGAGIVGAINTYVVLFSGATQSLGPPAVATWCDRINDADFGTTFKITRRGSYLVVVMASLTAGDVGIGFALDDIGPPQPSNAPTLVAYQGVSAAAAAFNLAASGIVNVSQAAAADPTAGVVRMLVDDNAGNAVDPADVVSSSFVIRISRVSDLNSES